jgi:hypothetical protein
MPFDIGEQTVRDGTKVKQAIVMTPKSAVVVGLKRINDLRKPAGISRVERWLIEQAHRGGAGPGTHRSVPLALSPHHGRAALAPRARARRTASPERDRLTVRSTRC